jgi:hypothetical protein
MIPAGSSAGWTGSPAREMGLHLSGPPFGVDTDERQSHAGLE